MKRLLRSLWWIGLVAVIVVGIAYAFWPQPVEVDVAAVARGPLQVTVDEDGRTRVRERYVVASPLAGQLQRIELDPGDNVKAGETVVAILEPADPTLLDERAKAEAEARKNRAEARVKEVRENLEETKKAHLQAKGEYQRARDLVGTGGVSREDYERAEFQEQIAHQRVRAADFAVQVANFELEQAKAALIRAKPGPTSPGAAEGSRFPIRSPITGRVFRLMQESATVVVPGTALLELGDPNSLEVIVDVLSSDAVKIREGARVWLEQWGGGEPLQGRVRLVEPSGFLKLSALGVEEQRVWVVIDFTGPLEKRKDLGDAYRVEARIVIWESADVLKVPAGALFRQGGRWAVFVVNDGRAVLRHVQVGHSNGLETEILQGLQPADQVILHPSDRIKDGVRVTGR